MVKSPHEIQVGASMNKDTVADLIQVTSSTTQSLAYMLYDAYEAIEQLENRVDITQLENKELKKQILHLQASIDAEMGCEGTTYEEEK